MRWARTAIFAIVCCAPGIAQAPLEQSMPVGINRGSLVSAQSGLLSVRKADGRLYDCSWDGRTLFTRHDWPIHASDLNGGEPVEVLSDRSIGTRNCYARTLTVVDTVTRKAAPPRDHWMPQGYLTFAGQVLDDRGGQIVIKTRTGVRTLHLRPDTKYSGDGLRMTPGSNTPESLINKHVFIRGGRTLYGVLEAYQVVWGEILRTQ